MKMETNNLPNKEKIQALLEKEELVAVYLFGSRAEGTANEQSDYDFGILFDSSAKMDDIAVALLELEERMTDILNSEVDVVLLNTASIEQKYMVISQGVLIYSKNEDERTDFEDIAIKEYLDFKPFLEIYHKEVKEAIKEGDFYA